MKSDKQNLISFPDPVLTEKPSIKNCIKYIAFFGPGAIVASITIGQGKLFDFDVCWCDRSYYVGHRSNISNSKGFT